MGTMKGDKRKLGNALESMGAREYMNHVTRLFSDPTMSQLFYYMALFATTVCADTAVLELEREELRH